MYKDLKFIGRFGYTQKQDSREDFYPGSHTRFAEWTGDPLFSAWFVLHEGWGDENIESGCDAELLETVGQAPLVCQFELEYATKFV